MPVITAFGKWKKKDEKFNIILTYMRPCPKEGGARRREKEKRKNRVKD